MRWSPMHRTASTLFNWLPGKAVSTWSRKWCSWTSEIVRRIRWTFDEFSILLHCGRFTETIALHSLMQTAEQQRAILLRRPSPNVYGALPKWFRPRALTARYTFFLNFYRSAKCRVLIWPPTATTDSYFHACALCRVFSTDRWCWRLRTATGSSLSSWWARAHRRQRKTRWASPQVNRINVVSRCRWTSPTSCRHGWNTFSYRAVTLILSRRGYSTKWRIQGSLRYRASSLVGYSQFNGSQLFPTPSLPCPSSHSLSFHCIPP